jgi:hypothetical protein
MDNGVRDAGPRVTFKIPLTGSQQEHELRSEDDVGRSDGKGLELKSNLDLTDGDSTLSRIQHDGAVGGMNGNLDEKLRESSPLSSIAMKNFNLEE